VSLVRFSRASHCSGGRCWRAPTICRAWQLSRVRHGATTANGRWWTGLFIGGAQADICLAGARGLQQVNGAQRAESCAASLWAAYVQEAGKELNSVLRCFPADERVRMLGKCLGAVYQNGNGRWALMSASASALLTPGVDSAKAVQWLAQSSNGEYCCSAVLVCGCVRSRIKLFK
jgi:hypothetical protein